MNKTYDLERFVHHNYNAVIGFSDEEAEQIAKQFYDDKGKPVNEALWNMNFNKVTEAVDKGYTKINDQYDVKMVYELKNNVGVWTAFKAYRMGKDVSSLLINEQGDKRPWGDFLKEYKKVDKDYNVNWLSAEYHLAQQQASAAKQWQDFERDKAVYPNLKYMPSTAANPRDAHMKWYGVVKPINDAFWNTALPPSTWGCQCYVEQTTEDITTKTLEPASPSPGIVGNPGKTGMIFNPLHPYVKSTTKQEKTVVSEAFQQLKPAMNNQPILYSGKKGKVEVSLNADPKDYLQNFEYAKVVMDKYPGTLKINQHIEGKKNPEYNYNGVIGDRTQMNGTNVKSYVDNSFKKCKSGQQLHDLKKRFLAFDFQGKLTIDNYEDMVAQLNSKIEKVDFVVLKNGGKVFTARSKGFNQYALLDKIKRELL